MNIYLDLDETIVDIITPTLKWLNSTFGILEERKNIKYYSYLKDTHGTAVVDYWSNPYLYDKDIAKPFEGAIEFVNTLRSMGFNIFILSNCTDKNYLAKIKYVNKYFNISSFISCFHNKKWEFLKKNDILVDDHYANCISHTMINDGKSILFNYNRINPWASESNFTTYDSVIEKIKDERLIRSHESMGYL